MTRRSRERGGADNGSSIASEKSLAIATGNPKLAKDIIDAYLACSDDHIFHKPVVSVHEVRENDPLAIAQRREAAYFKVRATMPGTHPKERMLTFHGKRILLLHSSGLVTEDFPISELAYFEADTHDTTRLNLVIAQVHNASSCYGMECGAIFLYLAYS